MMTVRADVRRWAAPAFAVVVGAVMAVILVARDKPGEALSAFAIMAVYSAVLVIGRRNETIGLLGSGEIDERTEEISRRAALFAGYVVITVIVGAFLWELAQDRDGSPYAEIGAVAGVSFIAATIWYKRRL